MIGVLPHPPCVEQLLQRVETVASLPEVTTRIMAMVKDPRSRPADLNRIIAHDPALITRVLRLVNSAHYGLPRKIDSVERAIVLLGYDTIQQVALAASMGAMFRGRLCDTYSARDLWTHCIGVGVVAREMAKLFDKSLAEPAFMAGILHDIGLLISLQLFPDKLRTVCDTAQEDATPFCVLEQDVIGVDHQELGAAIAARWGFPESCQHAARYHHHPDLAPRGHRRLVALVHVADTLCCQSKVGLPLTAQHQTICRSATERVPLPVIHQTEERIVNIAWTAISMFK